MRDYIGALENDDEVTFDDGWDRSRTIDKFKDRIRPILTEQVLEDPNISDKELKEEIEDMVDEFWGEFIDEDDEND